MSERLVPFATNEYYHIYNRGNSKQKIYHNSSDYNRFSQLLYLSNSTNPFKIRDFEDNDIFQAELGEKLVSIGAYCLMPNHFHILLTPINELSVSLFMRKLSTGFSMYFNKKYDRRGSLFEGKFKSQHVDSDEYLKYMYAYIHLNPIKLIQSDWKEKGIANLDTSLDFLEQYPYSSYCDYINTGKTCVKRPESAILDNEAFPDYFNTGGQHSAELVDWLSFSYE